MTQPKIICQNCDEEKTRYWKEICELCAKTLRMINSPMIKCQCNPDCKTMIYSRTFDWKKRTMKKGHEMMGERHHSWGGGVRTDKDGYKYIISRNHPYKDSMGYVPQHRLIMEHYYSIIFDEQVYLPYPQYEIHHIDENVKNNSLINLELATHSEHRKLHAIDMSDRYCSFSKCKNPYKVFIDKRDGRPIWRKNPNENDKWLHVKCLRKIQRNGMD